MIYMLTKFYEFISSETIFPILFGVPLFLSQIWYQKVQQKKIKRNEKSFNQNISIKELVTTTIWAALPLSQVSFETGSDRNRDKGRNNIQEWQKVPLQRSYTNTEGLLSRKYRLRKLY